METITAAAISTDNLIGEPNQAIKKMDHWLQLTTDQGAELVLFPECNVSGYLPSEMAGELAETLPGESTEKVIRLAEKHRTTICFGLIERDRGNIFCTHVLVNQNGLIGKQRKIHVPEHEKSA